VTQIPPSPEPELVARLCAGEPDALAQAYDRYAAAVYRIGYRLLGETADAEDLVQDVFTGLPRAARTFEGRSSFEHWLRRVATRTALMVLRQQRVQRRGVQRLGRDMSRFRSGDGPAARMDLESALRTLDERFRIVFVLREVEGYSYQEIAELLGIGVGTTRVRLYRARRRLREYLEAD
jgi:RNA polymerase sigma-70 factor (ECF subfamily)